MRLPIPRFKVLLYGPGLPPAGVKARAHFEASVLVVQGKGHRWHTIQGDKLGLKLGGFDGCQWLLSWDTPSGPATAMLQGEDAVEVFIKLAPPAVSEEMKRIRREHGSSGRLLRLGMASFALIVFLSASVVGLFWGFDEQISRWAADRVSQEQKDKLGEFAFNQMRPTLKLVERGNVRDMVEFVGVRVTTGSRLRYVFHVVDDVRMNAFAMPGGHVIVNTGLLQEMQNANELAAVLAHEASHVEMRHTLRNVIHELGWRAILAAVMGDFSSSIWRDMASRLASMSYSHDLELEADSEALVMLRRAGISADGMLPYWERMAKHETAEIGFWTTHPSNETRILALRQKIAEQGAYPSGALSVDWQKFQGALLLLSVN